MDTIKKGFASCLRDIRKHKKLTQEQLAEFIGINIRQLARIEAGKSFVTSETLYRICHVLKISPATLFSFTLEQNCIKDGTNNIMYINKNSYSEITQAINLPQKQSQGITDTQIFDIAKQLGRDVIVEESKNGEIISAKMYSANGTLQIEDKVPENTAYEILKNKISTIKEAKKKIAFLTLAFDALNDNTSLEKLKLIIEGMELTK